MKAKFGKTAEDYRTHRAGFPESFFASLEKFGLIHGTEEIVDLGTGTGTLARGLASMGCTVTGVDPSLELLAQAEELAREENVRIDWKEGTAEKLDLESSSQDVVTAGQCWHWFDSDLATAEAARVLKHDGLLLIAHFDWLPLANNVVAHTESLIKESNPEWDMDGGIGIYPQWFNHLSKGGFGDIQSYSYDESVLYTHEAWRGRVRASAGISGCLAPGKVYEFDEKHRRMLSEKFPDDPLSIPHRVFVVYGIISK